MLAPEKRARSSAGGSVPAPSLGEVFGEFLEPLFHQAVRLRNVYDAALFETATAYDVPVWRCVHPALAAYLDKAVAACKKSMEEGRLSRVAVCFFDGEGGKSDEVCVRVAGGLRVDDKSAPWLQSFFRESLLVLESHLVPLSPASSFQVELVCAGRMSDNTEWVLVEGRAGGTPEAAVLEPVRSLGPNVPAEVFVKRFIR